MGEPVPAARAADAHHVIGRTVDCLTGMTLADVREDDVRVRQILA